MAESSRHCLQTEKNKINPRGVRQPSVFPALLPAVFAIQNFHNCRCTHVTIRKSWAFNFGKCTSIYTFWTTRLSHIIRHGTAQDEILFSDFDVLESTLASHR